MDNCSEKRINIPRLQTALVVMLALGAMTVVFYRLTDDKAACAAAPGAIPESLTAAWRKIDLDLEREFETGFPSGALHQALQARLGSSILQGRFSVYIQNLHTGKELALEADTPYPAWSLLKIPIMAAVLHKVERREVDLNALMTVKEKDLRTFSLLPVTDQPGDRLAVRTLLNRLISRSDNTASFILARLFTSEDFQQVLPALGLPQTPPDQPRNILPEITARQFGNCLRILYHAAFLRRAASDAILAAMTENVFVTQIREGVPHEIPVANMVGFNAAAGHFHDIGIVYAPGSAYIICVMSRESFREEADQVIAGISRLTYADAAGKRSDGM